MDLCPCGLKSGINFALEPKHKNEQRFITNHMFSMLLINRELEQCFSLVRKCKHYIERILSTKYNNRDCTIVPYPTVEVNHT